VFVRVAVVCNNAGDAAAARCSGAAQVPPLYVGATPREVVSDNRPRTWALGTTRSSVLCRKLLKATAGRKREKEGSRFLLVFPFSFARKKLSDPTIRGR
jgi:hypothetical protein